MLFWSASMTRGPQTRGPQTNTFYGCAAGPVEDKVYSFGGFFYDGKTYSNKIDVHVFNTVTLRWMTLPRVTTGRGQCSLDVPSMCYGHTAELIEDTIYIWGGLVNCKIIADNTWLCTRGHRVNILYAFDVDTHRWFKAKVSGTVPEERYAHSACVLGKVMFIHGGCIGPGLYTWTNDTYKLDTTTMSWSLMNTGGFPPPVSSHHSATTIGTKMFVFGGNGPQHNNIRVFDTETNCWLSTPSAQLLPEQRYTHAAFAYNEELYIFGGNTPDSRLSCGNDLWKFNPKTFSWKKTEPKGKDLSLLGNMCCCMVGDCVILFGTNLVLKILYLRPSLKTLCKLAVIQSSLEHSGLPHNIKWELSAMATATGQNKEEENQ